MYQCRYERRRCMLTEQPCQASLAITFRLMQAPSKFRLVKAPFWFRSDEICIKLKPSKGPSVSQVTLLDVMSNSLFASMFRLASTFRQRCILFREQFISSRAIYFLASKFREHVSQSPFSTYLLREKVLSDRRQLRRRARQMLAPYVAASEQILIGKLSITPFEYGMAGLCVARASLRSAPLRR